VGEKKFVNALVVGGGADAGPPLGPALGPLGMNVMMIVKEINEKTKDYSGMRVPIKISVDTETKEFDVEVGIPTTSALIVKESGVEKGSGEPNTKLNGNLDFQQLLKIANSKRDQSYGKTLKAVVREIVGSCISMGVKIEEKDPREFQKELGEGKFDSKITEN
jgi:large subunit ribosomal protein L11|tara:strand:- start:12799 stop:13287 length:489 start_codon:yes stop_codon:yes gene_type:complete